MKFIPVSEPNIDEVEKKNIIEAFDSTWISSKGKYIDLFERKFAEYIGTKYATTTFNGTVSLHLILKALGIKSGDEVIVPTFTYIASVNAIKYVGATPIFIDSEINTFNMNVNKIEDLITKKTKAIIAVHIYGHSVDIDPLVNICKKNGIFLIEDAAEALGTKYKGKKIGKFGIASSFSFFANKLITTGEGGMITSDDENLIKKIRKLKNQGNSDETKYKHDIIGYNYRMTNLQAALGVAQLSKVNELLELKKRNANIYRKYLNHVYIEHSGVKEYCDSSFWMNSILLDKKIGKKRELIMQILEKDFAIETRPFFYPVHTMSIYKQYSIGEYPICEDFYYRGINLPSSTKLTEDEINYISNSIFETISKLGG